MTKPIQKLVEAGKVTSPKKQLNLRDKIVSFFWGVVTAVCFVVTTFWNVVEQIINNSADTLVPWLKTIPAADKPFYVGLGVSLFVGIVVLIQRRNAGPEKPKGE